MDDYGMTESEARKAIRATGLYECLLKLPEVTIHDNIFTTAKEVFEGYKIISQRDGKKQKMLS